MADPNRIKKVKHVEVVGLVDQLQKLIELQEGHNATTIGLMTRMLQRVDLSRNVPTVEEVLVRASDDSIIREVLNRNLKKRILGLKK